MLLFLYIYGTNIGICNSGVGKMKHPAFIFVLTKKEVLMVSVELKQEKHNALVSFLMIVIAALFLSIWAVHWYILQKRSGKIIP